MTDAATSYESLETRILRGRALGILPEETEDAILEEMDALWRLMTQEERDAANARIQEARRIKAPEHLNLKDVPLVDVPVESSTVDAWMRFAGIWAKDPDWQTFQDEMASFRRSCDAQECSS